MTHGITRSENPARAGRGPANSTRPANWCCGLGPIPSISRTGSARPVSRPVLCEMDVRVGGTYRIHWRDGRETSIPTRRTIAR